MRPVTVARSYAGALLELALKDGDVEGYARAIHELAGWMRQEPRFARFLETPRIRVSEKKAALREALADSVPERFLRFLYVVLDKGRQRLIPHVASEFNGLVDERLGRVHAEITLAAPADDDLKKRLEAAIEKREGRPVLPRYVVDPAILGGMILRIGDRVVDGSLRRRLRGLRKMLLRGDVAAVR